jgi:DUF1680 family protein
VPTLPVPTPPVITPASIPSRITDGVLADRMRRNIENLLLAIDVEHFLPAYRDEHDMFHAEPEFAGHYVDAALSAYRSTQDPRLRERTGRIVEIIRTHQREDGYLGAQGPGLEFSPAFGVWNQQFSIMALLLDHLADGDEASLDAARRCADFIMEHYLEDGGDFFDAINQGIEPSCILIEFVRIFEITADRRYLDFAEWIVDRWESGSMRLVGGTEVPVPRNISYVLVGTLKGAEVLICYRGLLRLALASGNDRYLRAAARYWDSIRENMIAPIGNGSVYEMWNPAASRPGELPNNLHPYENCVAVTWMQLSVELFEATGDPVHMDEYERTLFNHLLGAQAADGHDFSYYQGNVGTKVHETNSGWYACCRYRGMTMLTQVPGHVVFERDGGLVIALYADSESEARVGDTRVTVVQRTAYPRDGVIDLTVSPESPLEFTLQFRIPASTTLRSVTVNAEAAEADVWAGLATLRRTWSEGDRVRIELDLTVAQVEADLDERPAVLTTYGPLVLAIDSREGTPIDETTVGRLTAPDLEPAHPADWSRIVRFVADGTPLVDFASAGSLAPGEDRFRIWVTADNGPRG